MIDLRILLLTVVWACAATAVADVPSKQAKSRTLATSAVAIDSLCDRLAAATKDESRRRLFATISEDATRGPETWREYASDALLRARLQTAGTYEVAELWSFDGGAAHARTTASSDTGDWSHMVDYCYRPGGSLARTKLTMSSFNIDGGIRGLRRRHFAADGRQLGSRSETRDLETNRRRMQRDFEVQEPLYKTVTALPFAHLLH